MEADAAVARRREAEIEKAIRARVPDFKKQADSLTLEGVRRALEKDMGLEIYSLDAHKKFIKQCVDKVFSGSDDENTNNKASEKAEAKDDHSSKESSEDAQPMSGSNKISSSANKQGARTSETEKDPEGEKDQPSGSDLSEAMIKKAIDKRASYFRENSETLTLLGVRRTLEEDLKLEKKALDAYKSFITTELDKVLQEPANGTMKTSKKESRKDADQKTSKGSKRAHQDSDTSEINDSHSEREDSDEDSRPKKRGAEKGDAIKRQKKATEEKKLSTPKAKKDSDEDSRPKKRGAEKGDAIKRQKKATEKKQSTPKAKKDSDEDSRAKKRGAEKGDAIKRQKKATEEKKLSTPKAKKVAKRDLDKITEEQGGNSAEEDNSHSSAEEDSKKKRQPAPAYGKRVEHLKSIIKACGISVAPSVYRRVKQAPESKREAWLIKELEDILEKEGLSKNPSEKEIKALKKRKERAKELEGIDMSNIITSSRRRSTSSFIPLPKPKIEADIDDDEDDAEDDGDDDENAEGGDEGDDDDAEAGDGSADDAENESN